MHELSDIDKRNMIFTTLFYAIFQYKFTAFQIGVQYQLEGAIEINNSQMGKKLLNKSKKIISEEPTLRRSGRQKKAPKEDQFWRGMPNEFNWFAADISQDEAYPKRRKRNKYEDSQDYEGGHRSSKKKQVNTNKIEGLLEWRNQPDEQQIKIMTDLYADPSAKVPPLYKQKVCKKIVNENLEDLAQGAEALFINIEWGKKGQTLEDFAKLKIESNKFMTKGIAFIWAPKQLVADILEIMNSKNFFYVQNLEVINLNRQKAIELYAPNIKKIELSKNSSNTTEDLDQVDTQLKEIIKHMDGVEPNQLIMESNSEFFNCSKRTLLMFRKTSNYKIELRHQRTCDVVFDMPVNPNGKCEPMVKNYIYNMIQTLLPEALIVEYRNKTELSFKMVELWGDKDTNRRGWLNVIQH